MNLVYAALLLHSGDKEINQENIKKIVDSVDMEVDEAQIKALVAGLEDVDIEEAMEKSVAAGATTAPAQAEESEEETDVEEAEESEEETDVEDEEEAVEGLGSLF